MRILAVDIGTGTQDILLFDSSGPVENSPKLVLPSPTAIAAARIRRATAAGRPLLVTGTIAGGGPCAWALEDHLRAGLPAFATPDAARTFDDDLDRVRQLGVTVVSDDEAARLDADRVVFRDLDLDAIRAALAAFEVPTAFDGIAVGCLDHGEGPPGTSDRIFRFEHLARVVRARNDLLAFATAPADLPAYLTRARATVAAAAREAPAVFMDTGPAAALGALHDERVSTAPESLVLNLGNMHLLGFHLRGRTVASLFEHHTGEVTDAQVEAFARRLAEGSLTNDEVFSSKGHGALHLDRSIVSPGLPPIVAVTGPRRGRLAGSSLRPVFVAPFGDMMIAGCFGLLRAFAEVYPWARDEIEARLGTLAA